jgi:hypothetical protein
MSPTMIPIFNLATEAIALELIDAVRIATDDQFRLTLHGQIRQDNQLLYDETATAPRKGDSENDQADYDAQILAVVYTVVHSRRAGTHRTLTLTLTQEVP